jgi:hypothetical protein
MGSSLDWDFEDDGDQGPFHRTLAPLVSSSLLWLTEPAVLFVIRHAASDTSRAPCGSARELTGFRNNDFGEGGSSEIEESELLLSSACEFPPGSRVLTLFVCRTA